MSAGNTTDKTVRPILIAVMVLLLMVATISLAGVANADEQDAAFESFDAEFAPANPEAPPDVTIQWELAADAGDVDELRIAVTNESDEPINLYKPNDTDVPNPFTVSAADAGGGNTDVVVENLTAAALALKIPTGHCARVDTVRAFAYDGDNETTGAPDIQQELNCSSDADAGTFAVAIAEYDEDVIEGEHANVTAEIENTGNVEGSQDIRYLVDGDGVDVRENLTLGPDQSETVSFSYETNESDAPELEIAVESDDDNATRTVAVTQTEPAFFAVEIEDAPTEVTAGETIDVAVRVENAGGDNGTQNITLADFDGTIVDTNRTLDLSPGETTDVSLKWSTGGDDTGSGNVTVRSRNDTDTGTIELHQPAVESITVTIDDGNLTAGEETFAAVEATFTNGSVVNVTEKANLSSLNTTVATAAADGTVLAETEGTATIEAEFEGRSDADTLTVQASDSESESGSDESGSDDSSSGSSGGSGSETESSSGSSGSGSGSSSGGSDGESSGGGGSEDGASGSGSDGSKGQDADDGSDSGSDDPESKGESRSGNDTSESGGPENDASSSDGSDAQGDRTSSVVVSPVIGWLLLLPIFAVRQWSARP